MIFCKTSWRGIQLSNKVLLPWLIIIVSHVHVPVDVYIFLHFPARSLTRVLSRAGEGSMETAESIPDPPCIFILVSCSIENMAA